MTGISHLTDEIERLRKDRDMLIAAHVIRDGPARYRVCGLNLDGIHYPTEQSARDAVMESVRAWAESEAIHEHD